MDDTECPRCGSPMRKGGVCPVCEIPHDFPGGSAPVEPAVEPAAPTAFGRFFQSGRLMIAAAALLLMLSTVLPLMTVQRSGGFGPRVAETPWMLVLGEGVYGRELKSAILFALPGAAFGLLSFLLSRRTRSVMLASRPLVLVVAVIPVIAAVLPVLKIGKRHRFDYTLGPAVALIALAVLAGVIGAMQFGRGVQDKDRRLVDEED